MTLPSVPVFMSITGLYDVEYRLIVTCRNGFIYTMKRGAKVGKPTVELTSQPVGLERRGKCIIVATMDRQLQCYSNKNFVNTNNYLEGLEPSIDGCWVLGVEGKKLWNVDIPSNIICMERIEIASMAKDFIGIAVEDNKILIYFDKHLIDVIHTERPVEAMKFGNYGREQNALIMILKGGSLDILLLKRTAKLDANIKDSLTNVSTQKLNIPKKTKLFVDQTMRERDNAVLMHRTFQQDLYRLRLDTARAYVESLKMGNNPLSITQEESLKLSAQVLGLGPTFKIRLELLNTSSLNPSLNLFAVFHCDDKLYNVRNAYIEVPMLVPGVPYVVETMITCVSELGLSEVIRVFIVRRGNSKPLLSAVINMPASDVFNES